VTDPRPEFVYRFEKRGLFHFLFVLCALMFVWFLVVLFGETQGWGDDPGSWALIPTIGWAFIGLALFALFVAMALAQLVIRERPGQIYRLEGVGGAPISAPSFLQPQDAGLTTTEGQPAPDVLPETVAEAESADKPGQG
jgi:hypothetical protein